MHFIKTKSNREILQKENMMQLLNQSVKILPEGNMLNVSTVLKLGLAHKFWDRNTGTVATIYCKIAVMTDRYKLH